MWGTSSPDDKLTGDLGSVIETTQSGGRRLVRVMAGKSSPGNFGLLQQYLPKGDICIAADLFDHLVGEWEQLVGNIEAEFLKLARMDDVRRSRGLDHAAASNSARQRAPDRGAVRVAFACGGRARPIPKPLRIAMKAKAGPSGYA